MPDTTVQEVSTTSINFREALNALDKVTKDFTYSVFIPSLGSEVKFKEINTGQQKKLLQTVVDSPFYHSRFITTIYEMFKHNIEKSAQFDDFTIIDKQVVLL